MFGQVSELRGEILRLNHSLIDFIVGLKLHGAEVLEKEEHQKRDANVTEDDNEGYSFFI